MTWFPLYLRLDFRISWWFKRSLQALLISMVPMVGKNSCITFPGDYGSLQLQLISQYTFSFNNFSIIVADGGPGSVGGNAGSQITWFLGSISWQTNTSPQYSMAAAVTLIISVITILNLYDYLQKPCIWHGGCIKMKNSVLFKRRLNHFLTYLYMVVLFNRYHYPLLITVLSSLQIRNVELPLHDFS